MRFDFPIFVMLAMLLSLPLTLILVHERLSLNFLKGSVDEIYERGPRSCEERAGMH